MGGSSIRTNEVVVREGENLSLRCPKNYNLSVILCNLQAI